MTLFESDRSEHVSLSVPILISGNDLPRDALALVNRAADALARDIYIEWFNNRRDLSVNMRALIRHDGSGK